MLSLINHQDTKARRKITNLGCRKQGIQLDIPAPYIHYPASYKSFVSSCLRVFVVQIALPNLRVLRVSVVILNIGKLLLRRS